MRRPPVILAGLALGALGLVGCGGASGSADAGHRSRTPTTSTRANTGTGRSTSARRDRRRAVHRPRAHGPRIAGPPIGRTQTVHAGDAILRVTVTRLYDPLRGSRSSLEPGSRPVAVAVTIVDADGESYDSTASGDVGLVLSGGQAQPLLVRAGVCATPLTDFESLIGVGETRSGCVGFSVPRGSRVRGVQFSPHSRAAGTVSWRV